MPLQLLEEPFARSVPELQSLPSGCSIVGVIHSLTLNLQNTAGMRAFSNVLRMLYSGSLHEPVDMHNDINSVSMSTWNVAVPIW